MEAQENIPRYREIPYESDSELYFLFWALELKDKGIILEIKRAPSIPLTEGLERSFLTKDKKGREVTKSQMLLRPSEYTPEFIIYWDLSKGDPFVTSITRPIGRIATELIGTYEMWGPFPAVKTYIECKEDFDFANMTRLFKNNQKFIWDKHKIFINLVKTKEFFEKTFTPNEYLKTRTGKTRKLNYEPRTLEKFINDFKIN